MRRALHACLAWVAITVALPAGREARADEVASVPAHNSSALREPPPRPPLGDAATKAAQLFDAIAHDDPARAAGFFFPRDAFIQVKAMAHPERYYDRLRARFDADIHALHAATPELASAQFDHLELVSRGGWVAVGDEGNRLPYWACRHAFLHYRSGDAPRKLEVRVLITWDDHWYVIHLSEFH